MSVYTSRVLAACTKGDIALLHRISKETNLGKCLDKFGASPVHYAVRSGKRDCLQWLVMVAGLSPSTPAHNGAMPVHDAAATGQLDCLEWLVRKGRCNSDARDCAQATPLHLAARFGHLSVVEWLVSVEKCSPMERAQNGATPVHLAAAKGSMNCLKWLTKVEPRAVNLCSETGTSATYLAAQEGRLQCLQHLVREARADPRLKAADGMTPVHAAAQMGRTDCLAFLVEEAGMSVSEKDNDGATPLHFASARGHIEVTLWLLDHGARACTDKFGNTPLHDAAEHGQVQSIRILLDHGADPTIKDKEGFTPAELARECGHPQAATFLAKYQPPQRSMKTNGRPVSTSPGQLSNEQHSDSARRSSSDISQHSAPSLMREPQVWDIDSSFTRYHRSSVSTGSSSPDRPAASPSRDKSFELPSSEHPQIQHLRRHNSWTGFHPSYPSVMAAPTKSAHPHSPQLSVRSSSLQVDRPVGLPQWKLDLWMKRDQRSERITEEHRREEASVGRLEVPQWRSALLEPRRIPRIKATVVDKEKQLQENRLKLDSLPEWKRELFLKNHLGQLK